MYLNKVFIYGHLTKDPELRGMPSGGNVATFGVATNRSWKDNDGSRKEQTEFHNIVVFGKMAETIVQYIHKGDPIYIEGRIQTRSWEGQDGKKQYKTEVVAESFQFGPKRRDDSGTVDERRAPDPDTEEIQSEDIPY